MSLAASLIRLIAASSQTVRGKASTLCVIESGFDMDIEIPRSNGCAALRRFDLSSQKRESWLFPLSRKAGEGWGEGRLLLRASLRRSLSRTREREHHFF